MKTKIFFIIICSAIIFLQSSCKRDYVCVCEFSYQIDSLNFEYEAVVDNYPKTYKWSANQKCKTDNYVFFWSDFNHPQKCTVERHSDSWLNLF